MKYFASCATLDALKHEYRRLCKIYHPDLGGDTATMAAINNDYDEAFRRLQSGRTTTQQTAEAHEAEETPEAFRAVISRLVILAGINIEICGAWIWITGNTYPNRESIKAAGCRYSKNKSAWYWRPAESAEHRSHGKATMSEIRQKYGSQIVTGAPQKLTTA
nr:MAG TPA: Dna-J like membrane chaperone protein [Caudoviricetes sp.]